MTWIKRSANGWNFYQDPKLNNARVVQACSSSDWGDLGLAAEAGLQRREAFLETLGLKPTDLVAAAQVHGNRVRIVDRSQAGTGLGLGPAPLAETDALITVTSGVVLSIYTADCLPLFIYDPATPAVAIIHAGWRGSLQQIAATTVAALIRECGTDPSRCWAAIGPGLCLDCFQVQTQLAADFERLHPGTVRYDQSAGQIDLARVNREQLAGAGIKPERISQSGLCTSCQGAEFFSYRAQSATAKRMMSLIALKV